MLKMLSHTAAGPTPPQASGGVAAQCKHPSLDSPAACVPPFKDFVYSVAPVPQTSRATLCPFPASPQATTPSSKGPPLRIETDMAPVRQVSDGITPELFPLPKSWVPIKPRSRKHLELAATTPLNATFFDESLDSPADVKTDCLGDGLPLRSSFSWSTSSIGSPLGSTMSAAKGVDFPDTPTLDFEESNQEAPTTPSSVSTSTSSGCWSWMPPDARKRESRQLGHVRKRSSAPQLKQQAMEPAAEVSIYSRSGNATQSFLNLAPEAALSGSMRSQQAGGRMLGWKISSGEGTVDHKAAGHVESGPGFLYFRAGRRAGQAIGSGLKNRSIAAVLDRAKSSLYLPAAVEEERAKGTGVGEQRKTRRERLRDELKASIRVMNR